MWAQDIVDVFWRDARGPKPIEIRRIELMKMGRARPVLGVAATGVDQDVMVGVRISQECTAMMN
jgi:hypothetical protein